MSKRIPIKAAREFARAQGQRYVVIFAWDGERSHVVTYGKTIEDCSRAADLGNQMKAGLGWPESLHAQPSRVRKLQKEIEALKNSLAIARRYPAVDESSSGSLF